MRTLWILRHAKAAPHGPGDHSRPLAPRGRRQCAELAAHLAGLPVTPDLIVSSSALRALETAEAVVPGLGPHAEVSVEPALYEAGPDDVIDVVRRTDDGRPDVMVVGHNPTLLELALLALDDDARGRRQLEGGLPTAGLVVVALDVERWGRVSARGGRLVELFVPTAR